MVSISNSFPPPLKDLSLFTVSEDETKHMIYNTVEYWFNEGGTDSKDVAARAFVVNHSFRSESIGLGG